MPAIGPMLRGLRVAAHILAGVAAALAAALCRAMGGTCGWVTRTRQWWHRRLCRCLALELEPVGDPLPGTLLVANHISWLDVPALGALAQVDFVSKAEVRRWPLVGLLARAADTLFLRRGAHQASAITGQIRERLAKGRSVVIFPEGTTGNGLALRRFHPRLFAAAQEPPVPIQPVAVRYGTNAAPDPVAPFVGDDSLATHLLRVLCRPGIRVEVRFLAPIDPAGRDRRALAEAVRSAITARLEPLPVPVHRSDAVTREIERSSAVGPGGLL